jgi:hypothetical protein
MPPPYYLALLETSVRLNKSIELLLDIKRPPPSELLASLSVKLPYFSEILLLFNINKPPPL